MTVAALEALALRPLLAGGVSQPRRYFRDIARLIDVAWDMAVGGDLAFPQVPGPRPVKVRLVNAYLARLQAAAASDASLATAFIRVVGMLDRPETLLRPDRVIRVLRAPRHPIARPARHAPTPVPPSLERLARTPDSRRGEAAAYLDTDPISNGPTEAINLLIKKAKRVGHGLRNFNNYPLRLLPHCDVERTSNGTLPTPPVSAGSAAKEVPVRTEIGLIVVAGSVARTL